MIEPPNLSYVNEIAGADKSFFKEFMSRFKEEFRWEVGMYLRHIKRRQPREAARIVSKSKFKLKMLGLEKAFDFAVHFEYDLEQGDASSDLEYRKILENVNEFLATV